MRNQHVIILAATYRPFDPAPDLVNELPAIEPPKNFVDPEKKAANVRKKTDERNEALADVWALKNFESLRVCYHHGHDAPIIVEKDGIDSGTDIAALLAPICDAIAGVDVHDLQFVGVGVRDILRILRCRHGVDGLIPYQWIADQRNVIDAIGMLNTSEVAKHLDVFHVLRHFGINLERDYAPGKSCEKDCNVAMQVYNTLCRAGNQPKLAL